jgi:hypothetical protein
MSSGFLIADKLNLKQPTNVILEFSQSLHCFKVHFETDEHYFNIQTIEDFDRYSETLTDEEINAVNQIDFNQNSIYTWTRKITPSIARIKNTQILVTMFIISIYL